MARRARARAPVRQSGETRTALVGFRAREDFRYAAANASPETAQSGRGGERFLTTVRQFIERGLRPHPGQYRIDPEIVRLRCLDRADWAGTDYRGQRVLFLLPSPALGNNVCTALFLAALIEQRGPRQVGVFCAESAADIYRAAGIEQVHALWIARRDLKRWDILIDLGHLESRRNIAFWPIDLEHDLLRAFDLQPCARFSATARPVPPVRADGALAIGLLPLASSPLRTLPIAVTRALIEALAPHGTLTLCLNRNQHQGVLYRRHLGAAWLERVRVVDAFESIGALMQAIGGFDYGVFADSGPAHMAKLFATPGTAVYSSAPGEVLQGRFRNLSNWTIPFAGPHCRAPCGLAKVRQDRQGRIGCMGSLGLGVDDLPSTPNRQDPASVETLLLHRPVPCIAALADHPAALVDFVLADLTSRRTAFRS